MNAHPDDLDFRPLTRGDIPLLNVWFNAPHARRWFGDTPEEVDEEYLPMAVARILDDPIPERPTPPPVGSPLDLFGEESAGG